MNQGNFSNPPDDDRTIIIPVPGGRPSDIQRPPQSRPQNNSVALVRGNHINSLESAASGLLALLTHLRNTLDHPNPGKLRKQVEKEIKSFQNKAQNYDIDSETIYVARYILCTALDEAVLNTPWGQNSNWIQHSLLSSLHQEVSGGERFFKLLKSLAQQSQKNINTLEIMYICLSLGFEGKYRIVADGKETLLRVKEWLYDIIQKERGLSEQALSPHWQGENQSHKKIKRLFPLWALLSIASGILTVLYLVFLFQLNALSDPVFRQVSAIEIASPEPVMPITNKSPRTGLRLLLSKEISQNKIHLSEDKQKSKITIQGDGLFESGKAQIRKNLIPLINKVSNALNKTPGRILITGHTDNVPIFTAQFSSNWALSEARAKTVSQLIKNNLNDSSRVASEGYADQKNITDNNSADSRSKNRRVEIILYPRQSL